MTAPSDVPRTRPLEERAAAVARAVADTKGATIQRVVHVDGCTHGGTYRLSGRMVSGAGGQLVCLVTAERLNAGVTASQLQRRFRLTPRQAEVAQLLAERRSCKQISERLGISYHTACRHTEAVYAKLGVHRREEVELVIDRNGRWGSSRVQYD